MKKRILIFAETVTLAHFIRPFHLIQNIDSSKYDVYFAAGFYPDFVDPNLFPFNWIVLKTTLPPEDYLNDLQKGKLAYTPEKLHKQVEEDLKWINEVNPDVVVGDFRFTLRISAGIKKIPFINIGNLLWDPHARVDWQVSNIPITEKLGRPTSGLIFKYLQPLIFLKEASAFNRVAMQWGFKPYGNLLDVFSCGDYTFYTDIPNIFTTQGLPESRMIGGPIRFNIDELSQTFQFPDTNDRPLVLVSLGSSGPQRMLGEICDALKRLAVYSLVSTAGHDVNILNAENLKVEKYLPNELILQKANCFITNGGNINIYSSLAHGVPTLSIPINMDQTNYTYIFEKLKTGKVIHPQNVNSENVYHAVKELIFNPAYRLSCEKYKTQMAPISEQKNFSQLLDRILG